MHFLYLKIAVRWTRVFHYTAFYIELYAVWCTMATNIHRHPPRKGKKWGFIDNFTIYMSKWVLGVCWCLYLSRYILESGYILTDLSRKSEFQTRMTRLWNLFFNFSIQIIPPEMKKSMKPFLENIFKILNDALITWVD